MPQSQPRQHWVSIHHLQHVVDSGETAGLDGDALLRLLGMSRPQLDDAEATIPVRLLEAALESLLRASPKSSPDQPFGLRLAAETQPAAFGVLGLLSQSSSRLAEVLKLLVRYNGLLSDIGHFSLQPAPGRLHIVWECRAGSPLFRRHAREYVLGCLVVLGRLLLPAQTRFPLAVRFPHKPPSTLTHRREYQDVLRCPVHFEQPDTAVTIDNRLLATPLRHGDPALLRALEAHADELLQRRRRHQPLSGEVSRLITAMLGECKVTMPELARQLGLSNRSLQRRLHAENTGFQELLDRARLARARELLHDRNLPLDLLAAHIGLQSRQTLIRWFHRHTGQTPGQYREVIRP